MRKRHYINTGASRLLPLLSLPVQDTRERGETQRSFTHTQRSKMERASLWMPQI